MIWVNGEPTAEGPATVAQVVDGLGLGAARGVAVAVNAEVVPRGQWPSFEVPDEARVEVLTAMQGG